MSIITYTIEGDSKMGESDSRFPLKPVSIDAGFFTFPVFPLRETYSEENPYSPLSL
ncbi:MAG: hypothetical protein LBI28_11170 [Treponema sp.]|jgi:hypothetical protein|nr:hypothetical protein [Treponema sp.]